MSMLPIIRLRQQQEVDDAKFLKFIQTQAEAAGMTPNDYFQKVVKPAMRGRQSRLYLFVKSVISAVVVTAISITVISLIFLLNR